MQLHSVALRIPDSSGGGGGGGGGDADDARAGLALAIVETQPSLPAVLAPGESVVIVLGGQGGATGWLELVWREPGAPGAGSPGEPRVQLFRLVVTATPARSTTGDRPRSHDKVRVRIQSRTHPPSPTPARPTAPTHPPTHPTHPQPDPLHPPSLMPDPQHAPFPPPSPMCTGDGQQRTPVAAGELASPPPLPEVARRLDRLEARVADLELRLGRLEAAGVRTPASAATAVASSPVRDFPDEMDTSRLAQLTATTELDRRRDRGRPVVPTSASPATFRSVRPGAPATNVWSRMLSPELDYSPTLERMSAAVELDG